MNTRSTAKCTSCSFCCSPQSKFGTRKKILENNGGWHKFWANYSCRADWTIKIGARTTYPICLKVEKGPKIMVLHPISIWDNCHHACHNTVMCSSHNEIFILAIFKVDCLSTFFITLSTPDLDFHIPSTNTHSHHYISELLS